MITNALVPTSGVDLIVATTNQNLAVVFVGICNYGGVAATVDIHVVPNGQTYGNQTKIVASRSLNANDSIFIDTLKILLTGGDKVTIVGSVSGTLNATASYMQI